MNHEQPIIHGLIRVVLNTFCLTIKPVLSSRKALGLAAWSLHQCCKEQCCHTNDPAPHRENMNMYLILWYMVLQWVLPRQSIPKSDICKYSQENQ